VASLPPKRVLYAYTVLTRGVNLHKGEEMSPTKKQVARQMRQHEVYKKRQAKAEAKAEADAYALVVLERTYHNVLRLVHQTIWMPTSTPECLIYLEDELGYDEAEHDPLHQLLTRLLECNFWYNHWGSMAAMDGYIWKLKLFQGTDIEVGGVGSVMRMIESHIGSCR